jgi:hypothetical protein
MTATLSPVKGNPDEFSVALRHISKARPRVNVDAWTELDAALWWHKDYNPMASSTVSPSLILGLVARVFSGYYCKVQPVGNFLVAWAKKNALVAQTARSVNPIYLSMNRLCSLVHTGYAPTPKDGWDFHNERDTFASHLNPDSLYYCNRKTCKEPDSFLNGCVSETAFDHLLGKGYLVPWSSVEWGGLGTLMTVARNAWDTPYIYVRRERSHVKKPYVPYYVADAIGNLHRIVPQLLSGNQFQNQVKPLLRQHIAALETERLRFLGIVAMHSECDEYMGRWDYAFSTTAWLGESGEVRSTYQSYGPGYWGISHDVWQNLIDTEPDDLFPTIPDSNYQ